MKPSDILEGAAVRDRPKLYVLGCYDARITFYSQQVRALSLVHALHDLGYLNDAPSIAIIGAGAAGLTAAAAAALASKGQVVIFEAANDLLPLQLGTTRRKLDPHIYGWPQFDTTDTAANLPILDWEAGSARAVRQDVVFEFEDIVVRMEGRLEKRTRHKVKQIQHVGNAYNVIYDRLAQGPGGAPEQDLSDSFDMVFLAIGFGLEPTEVIQGVPNASYWSDAGVPPAEFAARPAPCFFVSGNGDGALIDLVAAGSADFDHGTMIDLITRKAGMDEIAKALVSIDNRARLAIGTGAPFNIFAAYEGEIQAQIEGIGLIREVSRRLRPGVQLTLQTNHSDLFSINTAILNRLAAFVTIKACEATADCRFAHIQCENVTRSLDYVPAESQPAIQLECDGVLVQADEVIIRRGPQRAAARRPFLEILGDYETTHNDWLKRYGNAILVPALSREARALFDGQVNAHLIPLSRRRQREAAAHLPVVFQLRADGDNIRWSGSLSKDNVAQPWADHRVYKLILSSEPAALGRVAGAVLRLASHARLVTLYAAPAHWRDFADRISARSPHAEGMSAPRIDGSNLGGAAQDLEVIATERLARQLHHKLDRWVLDRLYGHLDQFMRTGDDPRSSIGLKIAHDLRANMAATWEIWHAQFEDDGDLLNRFLRLMVCAVDDADINAAQVLVGPIKLDAIIRGTAVSLAIASSWRATGPAEVRPGNLRRAREGLTEWSGHSCAADRINGRAMPLCAGSYMWQTDFVILTVPGSIEVAQRAELPFGRVDFSQQSFTEIDGPGPVLMSISPTFCSAVEAGVDALAAMLSDVENRHFSQFTNQIQTVEEQS